PFPQPCSLDLRQGPSPRRPCSWPCRRVRRPYSSPHRISIELLPRPPLLPLPLLPQQPPLSARPAIRPLPPPEHLSAPPLTRRPEQPVLRRVRDQALEPHCWTPFHERGRPVS